MIGRRWSYSWESRNDCVSCYRATCLMTREKGLASYFYESCFTDPLRHHDVTIFVEKLSRERV